MPYMQGLKSSGGSLHLNTKNKSSTRNKTYPLLHTLEEARINTPFKHMGSM